MQEQKIVFKEAGLDTNGVYYNSHLHHGGFELRGQLMQVDPLHWSPLAKGMAQKVPRQTAKIPV
jgi:hypothetical protein